MMKYLMIGLLVIALTGLSGCSTISDTTDPDGTKTHLETSNPFHGKTINTTTGGYGLKVITSDPATQTPTPCVIVGTLEGSYHSAPMAAGQEYYVRHTTKSMWTSEPLTETVIYIGRATNKESLMVQTPPYFSIPPMSLKVDTVRAE